MPPPPPHCHKQQQDGAPRSFLLSYLSTLTLQKSVQMSFKCSYQFMAPEASASGQQIWAVTQFSSVTQSCPTLCIFIQARGESLRKSGLLVKVLRLFHRCSKRKIYKVLPEAIVELRLSFLAHKRSSSSTGCRSTGQVEPWKGVGLV